MPLIFQLIKWDKLYSYDNVQFKKEKIFTYFYSDSACHKHSADWYQKLVLNNGSYISGGKPW